MYRSLYPTKRCSNLYLLNTKYKLYGMSKMRI